MAEEKKRVVLITGASSGVGKACAGYLSGLGYKVYGTSRRAQEETDSFPFKMIQMDVCSDESVENGINFIMENEGRLDIVVNNAGISVPGAVEDVSIEQFKTIFETNFFGVLRVCSTVIPIMREQKSGYIVNISSMGGRLGMPFDGPYSSSKFAVEGVTEALRMEVKQFGIHVVLVEPGNIDTGMTARNVEDYPLKPGSLYSENFQNAVNASVESEANGISPDMIAHLLKDIINHPSPCLRYPVGSFSDRMLFRLTKILPAGMTERMMMKEYDLL